MSRTVKIQQIRLSDTDKAKLVKIPKTATEQARKVRRAKILLLINEKKSITFIADKLDVNRKAVELCIDKFLGAGIDAAINDGQRTGRPEVISDDEKAWIISIACMKPVELGYAQEL